MDITKLEKILRAENQPKYRLEQIRKAIFNYGISSFLDISTISLALRKRLDGEMKILSFDVEKVLVASNGQSAKALLNCVTEILLNQF